MGERTNTIQFLELLQSPGTLEIVPIQIGTVLIN